jgi:hypothetical protein
VTERRIEDVLDAVVSVGVRVLPDFVLAARDGDLTRLVVRGAAAARLVDPDGTARLVDAGGARTWADLEINGEPAVLELMAGHGVSLGATLPLSSGVGMASAVRVVFAAAPAAPEPEPEPEPVEPEPEASNYDRLFGETVHPAAGPILFTAEDEDADDVRGGGQACTLSGGPPTGAPAELEPSPFSLATPVVGSWPPGNVNGTAAGSAQPIIDVYPWDPSPQRMAPPVRATPAPAEQSARHRAGGLCETAGEPAQAVTPVPSTGADDEAAMVTIDRSQLAKLDQSGWAGPAVLAARCPDGHFSPANAGQCRVCRARIPPQEPVRITRPPLGVLRLTAGDVVPLDRGVVLGRAPEVADRPAADRPHAVRLAHAGGDISRAHVEVVLDGWHVLVTDLNSTNGTTCPTSAFQVVEGGRPVSIPLPSVCHVWVPTTMNLADVHFSAQWTTPLAGVTESVRGQDLALQAAGSARPGTGTIAVGVAGSAQRQPLTVQVIQPPLATVRPITVSGIKADESRTIDIRPYVTSQILNAAPTAISTAHTGGMNASVTANGGSLTVRPAHDARDQITFSLTITDVAGRTDRVVTGQLTLHVLGLPATIGRPAADANRTGGHQVQVSWPAPAYDGGAPIDQYRVRWAGGSHSCPASPCVVPGLRNGQPYTFTLAAHNIAGFWSAAESPASNPATPDAKPGPVTGLRISRVGDQTLGLTWAANHPDGTPVDRYQIEIADVGTNNPGTRVVQVGGGQTGYTATRLTNNDPYRFRVQAHNAVGWGPYGGAIPAQSAGKPAPMPVPSVPAEQSTSPQDQTVANVSWQPETDPNGPDVKAYSVYRKVGAGGYTVLANCRGLSRSTLNCVDTVQNDGTQYYYAVTAINGADIESTPTNGTLFLANRQARPDPGRHRPGQRQSRPRPADRHRPGIQRRDPRDIRRAAAARSPDHQRQVLAQRRPGGSVGQPRQPGATGHADDRRPGERAVLRRLAERLQRGKRRHERELRPVVPRLEPGRPVRPATHTERRREQQWDRRDLFLGRRHQRAARPLLGQPGRRTLPGPRHLGRQPADRPRLQPQLLDQRLCPGFRRPAEPDGGRQRLHAAATACCDHFLGWASAALRMPGGSDLHLHHAGGQRLQPWHSCGAVVRRLRERRLVDREHQHRRQWLRKSGQVSQPVVRIRLPASLRLGRHRRRAIGEHARLVRKSEGRPVTTAAVHREGEMAISQEQAGWFAQTFDRMVGNVAQAVLGKHHVVRLALTCLLSEGHLLLEDNPGTGKTSLAKALASTVQGSNSRIQFTPDLLPSDVTGVTIYDQRTQAFEFHPGPIFHTLVLADEINRASPKTQSALLEVMEEGRVTVDGVPHRCRTRSVGRSW